MHEVGGLLAQADHWGGLALLKSLEFLNSDKHLGKSGAGRPRNRPSKPRSSPGAPFLSPSSLLKVSLWVPSSSLVVAWKRRGEGVAQQRPKPRLPLPFLHPSVPCTMTTNQPLPRSRSEAKALGLTVFDSGRACALGQPVALVCLLSWCIPPLPLCPGIGPPTGGKRGTLPGLAWGV